MDKENPDVKETDNVIENEDVTGDKNRKETDDIEDIDETSEEENIEDIDESDDVKVLEEEVTSTAEQEDDTPVVIDNQRRGKGWKKAIIITSSVLVCLLIMGLYLGFTDHGNKTVIRLIGNYSYGKLVKGNDIEVNNPMGDVSNDPSGAEDKAKPIQQQEKEIYNILLLGVENFEGASNTDTMIVATIDTKHKQLKLSSLMRDIYVQIPDHQNNKLNAPYAIGGIDLLYKTIELNFGLKMDGYVLVNYSAFEDIIDYMGGVEITLTDKEARYLNRTNYISNPANRTVKEGTQLMNGNQALGYSRIRMVSTGKESDDFGRTSRQRVVIENLFHKVKSLNILDLGLKMNHILSNIDIDTDITKEEYTSYLEMAFDLRSSQLMTYRVPENKDYLNESHKIGRLYQDVLVPKSWDTTKQKLNEYINGEQ